MKNWKDTLISPTTPIIDAIRVFDTSAMQIALVVDEERHLLGTVTDGDIRGGILRGIRLEQPVEQVMCRTPVVTSIEKTTESILKQMRRLDILQIPIVDHSGRVVGLEILKELIRFPKRQNIVLLMAGGLGTRLRPLTDNCPKPMIKLGEKPIVEIILENFIKHGFYQFYFSVNYKADQLIDYFGDGSRWDIEIKYLREEKPMGTAGALSLLPPQTDLPLLVMNGDVLTNINFSHLLNFHDENKAAATMCVKEYDFQVPYGVVQIEKLRLISINEKPVQKFFINAGIYVINPDTLQHIPQSTFLNMTEVFDIIMKKGDNAIVFPIREYWLDVGRMDDFNKANGDYAKIFIPTTKD